MAPARLTNRSRGRERADERGVMLRRVARLMVETAPSTGVDELDPRVRAALEHVPRHRFVPADEQDLAYGAAPLTLGYGQTISQPFIVALMTQLAEVDSSSTVLEIGTGSGYQAAVLAELARRVYSIEIVPELARGATSVLEKLGYSNVEVRCGDGFEGWEERAPFDAILVTAAAPETPPPLVRQLAPGGRIVIPLGYPSYPQDLALLRKRPDGSLEIARELPVAFVPLTREEARPGDAC